MISSLRVPGRYAAIVEKAKERFKCGDLFEVVPSHVFHERCASPAAFYERLRERNPAPFEFLFNLGDGEYLVGASPEMYVRVQGDRVETCPISGTIARGADPLEDAANIAMLLGSAKEESELTMCTDVDRNDKSRVCVPGTVTVIGRRQIEMYSRLIHTVDHIEGRLLPGRDALDAFLTHMWAVTVTGAPKAWAMQFIEDNEGAPRRWYGGAVGKIGFDGSMNTGLTLRTAHIRNGVATVRAGATLLYDSDPESEERETHIKARALLETLREVDRERAAAQAGSADPVLSSSGSADYPDLAAPAPPRPIRVRAGRPPGLVRAHPGGLLPPAGRGGHDGAGRVPARAARPARARPGRALARTGPPVGLPLRRTAGRAGRRATSRPSASASGCRRWWSTRAGSCRCFPRRSTASRGGSGSGARRRCSPGCPRNSRPPATTPSTRGKRTSRAASRSPRPLPTAS